MARRWKVSSLVVCAAVGLLLVGCASATAPVHHHFTLTLDPNYPVHQDMPARWAKNFGVNSPDGVSLDLNFTFKPQIGSKLQAVSGNVVLKTPTQTYSVKLDPSQAVHALTMPDGRPLYFGSLTGNIKDSGGNDARAAMLVAFVPGGTERYVTLAAGTIGGEAEFIFGKPFLTQDQITWVKSQTN